MPILNFYTEADHCDCCGGELLIHKTSRKTISTLNIGEFKTIEIQKKCTPCQTIYRSKELCSLTPHGGQFGFDVIEFIGTALFIRCCNESQIQSELALRNVIISENEISFLGISFYFSNDEHFFR